MIEAIEALDDWWPPTFSPVGLGRTRLAWSTIAVASQSTRCSTAASTSRSTERWSEGGLAVERVIGGAPCLWSRAAGEVPALGVGAVTDSSRETTAGVHEAMKV